MSRMMKVNDEELEKSGRDNEKTTTIFNILLIIIVRSLCDSQKRDERETQSAGKTPKRKGEEEYSM